jgi:hypothetical protein
MLTAQRLREVIRYSPEIGEFRWSVGRRGIAKGSLAGSPNGHGYLRITIDGKRYCAHRLAWLFMTGKWPAHDIDHINGDRSDNRFSNLREATRAENMQNIGPRQRQNTSGLTGVSPCKITGKWLASITVDRRSIYIGRFATKEEARAAFLSKKATLHKFQPTPRGER